MSAPSIPGSVATHEDILRLEKRMDEQATLTQEMQKAIHEMQKANHEMQKTNHEMQKTNHEMQKAIHEVQEANHEMQKAMARLDERVTIGLAAVTRMQHWNFALLVLVLGALLARIVS